MAGFKKIYLVGHDCNYDNGSFKSPKVSHGNVVHAKFIIQSWFMFHDMVKVRYPDIEIINVNPVSMKLFKKEYI